ncbi:MAG: hypothetical protein Q8939_15600, partial [Bacteroidota bacterium]|nr:hypothetical protein [Bacteroidota bacterium]
MKPSTAVFIAMIFREFESALISVFISISCLACTITTTKVKNPILIKDSKSLSRDVNSVITSQEINVDGVESITSGKSTSELTINLINPENLSADSSANNTILKHVAILVKQALRDTAEYMR